MSTNYSIFYSAGTSINFLQTVLNLYNTFFDIYTTFEGQITSTDPAWAYVFAACEAGLANLNDPITGVSALNSFMGLLKINYMANYSQLTPLTNILTILGNTSFRITNVAYTSSTATYTYTSDVSVAVGQSVSISGIVPNGYNGTYVVTNIGGTSGAYTFTINNSTNSSVSIPVSGYVYLNNPTYPIVNVTYTPSTATYTYTSNYSIAIGQSVTIYGITPNGYNGPHNVINIGGTIGAYTFTINNSTNSPVTNLSGTVYLNYPTLNKSSFPIIAVIYTSSTATYTYTSNYSITIGQSVIISGIVPNGYNGTYSVTGIGGTIGSYTFTIQNNTNAVVTNPSGTVQVPNTPPNILSITVDFYNLIDGLQKVLSNSFAENYSNNVTKGINFTRVNIITLQNLFSLMNNSLTSFANQMDIPFNTISLQAYSQLVQSTNALNTLLEFVSGLGSFVRTYNLFYDLFFAEFSVVTQFGQIYLNSTATPQSYAKLSEFKALILSPAGGNQYDPILGQFYINVIQSSNYDLVPLPGQILDPSVGSTGATGGCILVGYTAIPDYFGYHYPPGLLPSS